MISIVICSVSTPLLGQVKANIRDSIGVPYEILAFDNRANELGICAAYNKMAARASYPIVCFMHEDVTIGTQNWGNLLVEIFSNNNIGCVGLAGSKYKSKFYSGWYTGHPGLDRERIFHRHLETGTEQLLQIPEKPLSDLEEVITLDGVFIVTRKEVWQKVLFNEKVLKGFHLYDIDYSIRASLIMKNMVTYRIDLIHHTLGGSFGDAWIDETIKWHNEYKDILPRSVHLIDFKKADEKVIVSWLDWLKTQHISFNKKRYWIYSQQLYTNPAYFYSIFKFLLYKPLGLEYIHRLFKK